MQPDSVLAADAGNFGHRIDGVRGSRSHGRTHEAWDAAVRFVLPDLTGEFVGAHRKVLVDSNRTKVLRAKSGDFGGFFDRGVCLRGTVRDKLPVATLPIAQVLRGALAPSEQCAERRTRGRVLDDAAP